MLLGSLTRRKLFGIGQGAEESSEGVPGDILIVVSLVSHLTGAPATHPIHRDY